MSKFMRKLLPPIDAAGLSPREIEILKMAPDHTDAQIAGLLGIQRTTVKKVLNNARNKHQGEQNRLKLQSLKS